MEVYGLNIPDKPLSNFDLSRYAEELKIPHFRGVFMRDALPLKPRGFECGIVNFNLKPGSHWVCWYKKIPSGFISIATGNPPLYEIQKYLKTPSEINKPMIQ